MVDVSIKRTLKVISLQLITINGKKKQTLKIVSDGTKCSKNKGHYILEPNKSKMSKYSRIKLTKFDQYRSLTLAVNNLPHTFWSSYVTLTFVHLISLFYSGAFCFKQTWD